MTVNTLEPYSPIKFLGRCSKHLYPVDVPVYYLSGDLEDSVRADVHSIVVIGPKGIVGGSVANIVKNNKVDATIVVVLENHEYLTTLDNGDALHDIIAADDDYDYYYTEDLK